MNTLAVVGTRSPTLEGLILVRELAMPYITSGWHVITGAADGVDGFIMDVMNQDLKLPERLHVSLPWVGFGSKYLNDENLVTVFDKEQHAEWLDYVDRYHPNAKSLKWGSRCLLARSYDIASRCDIMLALPSNKPNGGGTGYAICIAKALGKEVVNLAEILGGAP